MATPVIMPRQGQSVESCILTQWFKEVGDTVEQGDLLFAYETDKAAFEEEAPESGKLLARYFEEGDEVPVLSYVAVIGSEGDNIDEFGSGSASDGSSIDASADKTTAVREATDEKGAPEKPKTVGPVAATEPEKVDGTGSQVSRSDVTVPEGKVRISPRARRLAKEKRVVYDSIRGTGPEGRIIERDILEEIKNGKRLTPLAEKKRLTDGLGVPEQGKEPYGRITSHDLVSATDAAPASGTGKYTDKPLSNMRKIISAAMYRSLQNSAQLTHHLSANASRMLQLRNAVKARMKDGYEQNITLNDMVCFAVIRALKNHPDANAHFMGESVRIFNKVNLGLAVDTERGLMVPALLNADDFSLPGLSSQLKKLADSAKKGNINPDLLNPEAASFTVSNLGNYGVEMFTPVINLPQVAILGVNTIIQRPTTLPDGSFGFQPFIGLSLTYDHRALDGGPATLFLADIKNEIENLSVELL